MAKSIGERLFGKALATADIAHEKLTNMQGLAIFASDALSSTAYATDEILLVLAGAGMGALFFSIPVAIAISLLIIIVAISYRQVIYAYPQGGGVYSVARENLGEMPGLIGASALLIDYVLTAAVSTVAGVAAITSAFPELFPHRIAMGIGFIILLMWGNLRGVRSSGKLFSIPAYIFITTAFAMIGYGIWRFTQGTYPIMHATGIPLETAGSLGLLLILRAFGSGCSALTGIEAISNGVQAFKTPSDKNASKTLIWMAVILVMIFFGFTLLAHWGGAVPVEGETIMSQIARALFGRGPFYFLVQGATALILLLAANTPFADFPRVVSFHARDGYLPRQFLNLGSRLVFKNGIILLSVLASLLIFLFDGSVHALIPLYAVGVFLGFSLSQLGMIVYWRRKGPGHMTSIIINTIGFITTSVVFIIVLATKFVHGAWILLPAIVLIQIGMRKIRHHYTKVEKTLALENNTVPEVMPEKTAVILVSRFNVGTLYALKLAKSFQPAHIRAVHIAIDEKEGEEVKTQWGKYVTDVPIDILHSEYRDLIGPILNYLKEVDKQWKNDSLIVFIPQIASSRWWHFFLHNQTNRRIQLAIEQDPDINPDIYEVTVKTPKQQKPL